MKVNVNLESLFDQGKKKEKSTTNQRVQFNPNNYLNTRLGAGETERKMRIRIILTKDIDGKEKMAIPYEIHSMKLSEKQKDISTSGFKSFNCLNDSHFGEEKGCPLCNKKKELFAKANNCSDPNEKKALLKEAYSYNSKTTYVVRCIERGHEEDGVKFWRFNKWDDGSGCFDMLKNLALERNQESEDEGEGPYNMFNYEDGKDIIITLSRSANVNPKAPDRTAIKISDVSKRTPLSDNPELVKSWLNDNKDWRDMYRVKSYDYLQIVAEGESPVFDNNLGKFIAKEEKIANDETAEAEAKANVDAILANNDNNIVEDSDLPF